MQNRVAKIPSILAGDFNGKPSDKSMELLDQTGWETLEKKDPKNAATYPSRTPKTEIDFFVIKNFPKVDVAHDVIEEKVASDH